jgi:pilus assembly protein Flp/PilA
LRDQRRLRKSGRVREEEPMTKMIEVTLKLKIWKDNRGQDLVEYALMAGFLACASAYTLPQVAMSISNILNTVIAMLNGGGSTSGPI